MVLLPIFLNGCGNMNQTERMAAAVGKHVERMTLTGRVWNLKVFCNEADKNGWMEWLIQYEYSDGGKLTVGAILRTPDQETVEFHS